jgi:drug/metabolite transporter (DMT)-like permease
MVLTMLLWGGTFSAGKLASEGAGPFTSAFVRFLISAALLLPQLRLTEGRLLPKSRGPRVWALVLFSALTGLVLYNVFFIKGLSLTGAGRGSVIVAVNPACIYLGSVIFFGERLSPLRVLGIVLAVSGTVLVVSSGRPWRLFAGGASPGDLFMLGCVVSLAAYSLLGKLLVAEMSPLAANAWGSAAAAVMLFPLLLASGEPLLAFRGFSASTWGALAFLGVCGTVLGFTFFYRGILALGPSRAGIFICLVPVFGILCGALVFGESLRADVLWGLALSLAGLTLVQKY